MGSIITVTLWTLSIFAAILLHLTFKPKIAKGVISCCAVATAVGSMLIYCYGYAVVTDNQVLAVIKATFAVCRVFVGSSSYGDIAAAPLFEHVWAQILIWLLQLMGLFSTTSAAISKLGDRLLRQIRMRLARKSDLSVIFGVTQETLSFGRELAADSGGAIVFVDASGAQNGTVSQLGGILRSDADALGGNVKFLKSLGVGPGKRKIRFYGLNQDMVEDQRFAQAVLRSLEELKVNPEQTALTIRGGADQTSNPLQAAPGHYGYGEVIEINEPEMAARVLMREYPPCDHIHFDETGKAEEDFHGLIVGFGQVGQAVLRQMVMNGQFEGSHFRVAVFAPDYEQVNGRLWHECESMITNYDISFLASDARSRDMYEYLAKNAKSLKYIAVCTGSVQLNSEIADQLRPFLARHKSSAKIYMCNRKGVRYQPGADRMVSHDIYSKQILCSDQIDRMAMELNQSYCAGNGKTLRENWRECDYFSRMSSRASADFMTAMLRMAHMDKQQVLDGLWAPEGELLENLARTEHLRWCAFHYSMGFRTMTEQEYEARCRAYRAEVAEKGASRIRLGKDLDARIHACLIGWEELDALSDKENRVTGGKVNYKQMDRNNVLAMPEVLKAGEA